VQQHFDTCFFVSWQTMFLVAANVGNATSARAVAIIIFFIKSPPPSEVTPGVGANKINRPLAIRFMSLSERLSRFSANAFP
jgi:hypothetical protein